MEVNLISSVLNMEQSAHIKTYLQIVFKFFLSLFFQAIQTRLLPKQKVQSKKSKDEHPKVENTTKPLASDAIRAIPKLTEAERMRQSPFERVIYDMAHNERIVNDLILGRRVGFYELRGEIGQGNFSAVRLGIHALTKGLEFKLTHVSALKKNTLDQQLKCSVTQNIWFFFLNPCSYLFTLDKTHHWLNNIWTKKNKWIYNIESRSNIQCSWLLPLHTFLKCLKLEINDWFWFTSIMKNILLCPVFLQRSFFWHKPDLVLRRY